MMTLTLKFDSHDYYRFIQDIENHIEDYYDLIHPHQDDECHQEFERILRTFAGCLTLTKITKK